MKRVFPTRLFLVLLAAGTIPAALPLWAGDSLWPLSVAWWAALAGGALLDGAVLERAGRPPRVECPDRVGVGDSLNAELELENPLPFSLRGEVLLQVTPPLEGGGKESFRLLAGGCRLVKEIGAPKRGEGALEAAWVALRGPLGLLRLSRRHPLEGRKVRVLPNLRRVRKMLLAFSPRASLRGGVIPLPLRGEGGEFDTLEAYVPGMDPRSVDWKASARHQSLVVRRYRLVRNQRVVLVLDTGRLMGDELEGLERLDHAVHGALTLAWTALKEGDLVGIQAYGERPGAWLPPAAGMRHLQRIRTLLGGLQPGRGETNHAWGLGDLMGKLPRRSLVTVFTEFTDPAMAALMVENVEVLALRHQVVFVVLEDPGLEEALERRPSGKEETARAVVAARIRWEREQVLHRLQGMGVRVVRGRPGEAVLKALSAYFEVKAREKVG